MEGLYKYQKELKKRGIILTLCGPISHEVIQSVGTILRAKLSDENASTGLILKVFSVFVEQAENIIRYSISDRHLLETYVGFGILVVGHEDNEFFITCGNKIENSKVSELEANLIKLQNMDKDELKRYYKKKRKEVSNSNSKGAGIGFIEMARKASKPIEFMFEKIDDNYSFFTVNVVI